MLAYLELTKPRVTLMVALTALVSFYLASTSHRFRSSGPHHRGDDPAGRRLRGLEPVPGARGGRADAADPKPAAAFGPDHAGKGAGIRSGSHLGRWALSGSGGELAHWRSGVGVGRPLPFRLYPFKKKSPLCTTIGAFPGATPCSWAGREPGARWIRGRGSSSPCSSSGSTLTFWRLRGSIETTIGEGDSGCCPRWTPGEERRRVRS